MRAVVLGFLVVCCLELTQLYLLGLPILSFKDFLRYTRQFFQCFSFVLLFWNSPRETPQVCIENIIYLALEREGDNVWSTVETSVLFLNIIKEFPFIFLSIFPSGEMEAVSSSIVVGGDGNVPSPLPFCAGCLSQLPPFSRFSLVFLIVQSFPVHPINLKWN